MGQKTATEIEPLQRARSRDPVVQKSYEGFAET